MKIGILTFHIAHNYGAVLQAYGMQEVLCQMGYDAYIIDYKPQYKIDNYKVFNWRHWASRNPIQCIKRFAHEVSIKPIRYWRWRIFNNFIQNNYRLSGLNESYDVVIIGSDQVWSPALTGGKYDPIFFGEGVKSNIYISYAASSQHYNLSTTDKTFLREKLKKLSHIGVREEGLKKVLRSVVNRNIQVVLDPSIIAGNRIFNNISITPKEQNYLLLYEIGRKEGTYDVAKYVANKLKLQIIELVSYPTNETNEIKPTVSPGEFVGYFQNADFVVTTSFHGLAFALMNKKPFFAVRQHNSADERLASLLSKIDGLDFFIEMSSTPNIIQPDFDKISYLLNIECENSLDFLKKAIKGKKQ